MIQINFWENATLQIVLQITVESITKQFSKKTMEIETLHGV